MLAAACPRTIGPVRTIRAHAKLNLALAVAPPEPPNADRPGWHRIASWFHSVELHDTVRIETGTEGFAVAWIGDDEGLRPVEWALEHDLAYRAKAAFEAQIGETIGAKIDIAKRIPAGAGLGGGSSDAASVLLGLNTLVPRPVADDDLATIAAPIGSDLTFFLDAPPPRPALVRGFGDRIDRRGRLDLGVVLIIPPFGCSTPAVYAAYDGRPRDAASFDRASLQIEAMCRAGNPDGLFNDLEPAACAVEPRLGAMLDSFRSSIDRPVHMTGSGSAMFVLCDRSVCGSVADRARETARDGCRVIETFLI